MHHVVLSRAPAGRNVLDRLGIEDDARRRRCGVGFFSCAGYSLRLTTRMKRPLSTREYSRRTEPLPGCPSTVPCHRPTRKLTRPNGSGVAGACAPTVMVVNATSSAERRMSAASKCESLGYSEKLRACGSEERPERLHCLRDSASSLDDLFKGACGAFIPPPTYLRTP